MGIGSRAIKIGFAIGLALATMRAAADRMPASYQNGAWSDIEILKQLPQPASNPREDGRHVPNLWLGSVNWARSEETLEYSVDDSLAPTGFYSYNFTIAPKLVGARSTGIDDSYLLMRMVVLSPRDKSLDIKDPAFRDKELYRRFVTGTETVVKVTGGMVTRKVTFKFPVLSALAVRNTLLIQFLPINNKKLKFNEEGLPEDDSPVEILPNPAFVANVIKMPFIPRDNQGFSQPPAPVFAGEVSPEERLDLGAFMRAASTYKEMLKAQNQRMVRPEEIAKTHNLRLTRWDEPLLGRLLKAVHISPDQLEAQVNRIDQQHPALPEKLAEAFCYLLARRMKSQYADVGPIVSAAFIPCTSDPEEAFELSKTWHVIKLKNGDENRNHYQGAPASLSMSLNFGRNRTHTEDFMSGLSQGFSLNPMNFLPIDIKGVSLNLGYTETLIASNSRSRFEGHVASESTVLDIPHWSMNLEVERYIPCVMVRANRAHRAWAYANELPGFYICGKQTAERPVQFRETYFCIQPADRSSSAIDPHDPRNQIINMTIRGLRDYSFFRRTVQEFASAKVDDRKAIGNVLDDRVQAYHQAFPSMTGVLSMVVDFEGPRSNEWRRIRTNPTQWDRWRHRLSENFK